jgi:cyclopropane fatty-acyl-phospholipid synthase-like methyltransferase
VDFIPVQALSICGIFMTTPSADFTEAEIQALIAHLELEQPVETPNNNFYTFYPKTLSEASSYFRSQLEDWTQAYTSLQQRGLFLNNGAGQRLTEAGISAAQALRRARPPIYYWYCDFYRVTLTSRAHAVYCEQVFGKNLCQDGFAGMEQLIKLLEITHLNERSRALDLGCGNGMIAEYLSDITGARFWGMDYVDEAIRQACERTREKADRLSFKLGNLDCLEYPPASFDTLISIDTLYMPNDLDSTLRQMARLLQRGGQMAIFYSYTLNTAEESSGKAALHPENTPLGQALLHCGLPFQTWDFTSQDYHLALRRLRAAEELRPLYAAEGNLFLHELLVGTGQAVKGAIEAGRHTRCLYYVQLPPTS